MPRTCQVAAEKPPKIDRQPLATTACVADLKVEKGSLGLKQALLPETVRPRQQGWPDWRRVARHRSSSRQLAILRRRGKCFNGSYRNWRTDIEASHESEMLVVRQWGGSCSCRMRQARVRPALECSARIQGCPTEEADDETARHKTADD